jgi:hypothetical protein
MELRQYGIIYGFTAICLLETYGFQHPYLTVMQDIVWFARGCTACDLNMLGIAKAALGMPGAPVVAVPSAQQ